MSVKGNRYHVEKMIDNLSYIIDHMRGVSKEEFKEQHADIEWSQIFGMRNRLVHDYGNVDYSIVYETISMDIPQLKSRLEDI